MGIGFIFLAIAIVAILFVIIFYNRLIGAKNKVDYANGAVDAMYKQRYDLIPNLVASVKQYMEHEKGLLTNLTEMRSQSQRQMTDSEKETLNIQLDKAVKSFNVTVENYPNLKADHQFSMLQASLNECEGQLAAARRTFNAAVMEYNNTIEMFPTNILASMMRYTRKEMIKASQSEQQRPDVTSLFK